MQDKDEACPPFGGRPLLLKRQELKILRRVALTIAADTGPSTGSGQAVIKALCSMIRQHGGVTAASTYACRQAGAAGMPLF